MDEISALAPNSADSEQKPIAAAFTPYQKFVVGLLAFLQFTIVLDFMIMSPLGAIMMPALSMTTAQFGIVVSVYAFSAGASGLLAAGFADRFDRKKILMFFYVGFILGTLFCALAPNYISLLLARMVTGLFGGVMGSIVLAITTDLFPMSQRGRVMGFIQTAFAGSQILGIPLGLYLANLWGWHAPFLAIVIISIFAAIVIWYKLQPVDEHLKYKSDRNVLLHLWHTLTNANYLFAFAVTGLMSVGGFMLMPFSSAFSVHNLGISLAKLPMVYLLTGLATIFITPLVGRFSDIYGKMRMFVFGAISTIVMVVIYTNLGITPVWLVVLINILMFCAIFSRIIPAQAMISGIPSPENRGAFMAVNASLQQIAGGIASVVAGLVVVESATGKIEHFDTVGYILSATVVVSVWMLYRLQKGLNLQ